MLSYPSLKPIFLDYGPLKHRRWTKMFLKRRNNRFPSVYLKMNEKILSGPVRDTGVKFR